MKFNKSQLDRLSEFLSNVSLFFFATTIAPLILGNLIKLSIVIEGIILSASFLIISLSIIKK